MSYKYTVEQVSAGHYVLPRTGAMRTEVHGWLSPALFAQTDEALWSQAARAAASPGAIGLHLMPDTHLGYGIPVGGVLVTEDTVVQAGSGYDISCGVVYLQVPGLHAADVADVARRRAWVDAVEARVATGLGTHRPRLAPRLKAPLLDDVLRHGARALGVRAEVCERQFIPVTDAFNPHRVQRAHAKALPQLGSVGGGNHFIELQVDRDDGQVFVMVHCGSRGYGWQTANHFFFEGAALRGLPRARREESWLRIDEPLGRLYWDHHNSAANYAVANRHLIVQGVREATQVVFGHDAEVYYEISHNLVQEETLVLPDGSTQRGFVHRKGATRAFPAGHPDLVGTPWAATGHPCLIPGSMLDGAAILFPEPGAHRSACSVNHGSGRVMGRGQAKRDLAALHDDIDAEMQGIERMLGGVKVRGVVGNTARTPLDECHHVYKELDAVIEVLALEGIARLDRRLYPVANLKGTD
ncbi:MAG: RtcB family protein [Myxococcales bacterium]|nr:RtcB family protein [Myxococcales bacterium]